MKVVFCHVFLTLAVLSFPTASSLTVREMRCLASCPGREKGVEKQYHRSEVDYMQRRQKDGPFLGGKGNF